MRTLIVVMSATAGFDYDGNACVGDGDDEDLNGGDALGDDDVDGVCSRFSCVWREGGGTAQSLSTLFVGVKLV